MANGKVFQIRFLNSEVKASLRQEFFRLEEQLKIDGLGDVLNTATLELIENAVRANLKRAYFEKHGYSLSDEVSYNQGVKAFKNEIRNVFTPSSYDKALAELKLVVSVMVDLNQNRLIIFVENNTIMQSAEEERIRQKMAQAMESNEMSDFFLHYGDETEGSGFGLALIIFLIKGIGFDPSNFRVFQDEGKTVARIEFPLTADYVPIRDKALDAG